MSDPSNNDGLRGSLAEAVERLHGRAAAMELMAGTVHDSRNIMAGVLSFAQVGEHRTKDAAARQLFSDIAGETERCIALLERVLRLLRGAGPDDGVRGPVALGPVVDAVVGLVQGAANIKRSSIQVVVPPDLKVIAQESGVLQIVLNLVLNAVQASPADGIVVISGEDNGKRVCLKIRDAGAGVPSEDRERVFEPFFTTKHPHGTGIGLSSSRTLARSYGGDVVLEPQESAGGATFSVHLPNTEDD